MSESRTDRFEALTLMPANIQIDGDASLRQIVPADAEVLMSIVDANPDTREYVTWASQVKAPSDVVSVLQEHSESPAMIGRYALTHNDVVKGYIGIFPGFQTGEYGLGYFIDQSLRGRGYITRGVAAIIEVAKATLHPKHLYLQIALPNMASIVVARRLGFEPAEEVWDESLQMYETRFRMDPSDE